MYNNYTDEFKRVLIAGPVAILIAIVNLFLIPSSFPDGLTISGLFSLSLSRSNIPFVIFFFVFALLVSGLIFSIFSITFFIKAFKSFVNDYFNFFTALETMILLQGNGAMDMGVMLFLIQQY